jgi:hypothetical protein
MSITPNSGPVPSGPGLGEAHHAEVLRSSLSEIATWIAAWQMPCPLYSCILTLVTNTGGAKEFRPTLWEECASGVEEKAIGTVDGIGGM